MKIMSANRKTPDGTPRFAASHLGLFCLHMSHKKDARLICVNAEISIILASSLLAGWRTNNLMLIYLIWEFVLFVDAWQAGMSLTRTEIP